MSAKTKAQRKIEIAIDKMVDLQSMVVESEEIQRVLDHLNNLRNRIEHGSITLKQ
jgi:hypothetical protein